MTSQNTNDTESFNYEWYFWDNMPVRVWSIIDNNLYFGTEDGRICSFDDKYVDRKYETVKQGNLLIDYDNDIIVFNKYLGVKDNDTITFTSDVFKIKLRPEQILDVKDNSIFVDETDIMKCFIGNEIYVDNVGNSGLELNTKYIIHDVNLSNCSFVLANEQGEVVSIKSKGFRICENIKNKELIVVNKGESTFQARAQHNPENIDFIKYNNSIEYQTPTALFVMKQNVVANWFSPVFDFGTNQASKTLLALTISTEPTTRGKVEFGYSCKNSDVVIDSQGIDVFDFETLDFNNFTFDSSFANSYTIDIKDYFNFIQFFFTSDNEYSCAIHSLTINYKINSKNKGVE